MLNIYTDKKYLPKGKTVIADPEAYIMSVDMLKDEVTKRILAEIEQATPLDRSRILDRFGTALYAKDISTSTKILLEAHQTDDIITAVELGNNALGLISLISDGNLYFPTISPNLDNCEFPICLNNKICNNNVDTWGYTGVVL